MINAAHKTHRRLFDELARVPREYVRVSSDTLEHVDSSQIQAPLVSATTVVLPHSRRAELPPLKAIGCQNMTLYCGGDHERIAYSVAARNPTIRMLDTGTGTSAYADRIVAGILVRSGVCWASNEFFFGPLTRAIFQRNRAIYFPRFVKKSD